MLFCSFLTQAVSLQQTTVVGETLKVADLRFVELRQVPDPDHIGPHQIRPICPAALLAILEFLRLRAMEKSDEKVDHLINTL